MKRKRAPCDKQETLLYVWLRGLDLNQRPSGYLSEEYSIIVIYINKLLHILFLQGTLWAHKYWFYGECNG